MDHSVILMKQPTGIVNIAIPFKVVKERVSEHRLGKTSVNQSVKVYILILELVSSIL